MYTVPEDLVNVFCGIGINWSKVFANCIAATLQVDQQSCIVSLPRSNVEVDQYIFCIVDLDAGI
jgi:hypothetical protein